jgi:hypothetical protein
MIASRENGGGEEDLVEFVGAGDFPEFARGVPALLGVEVGDDDFLVALAGGFLIFAREDEVVGLCFSGAASGYDGAFAEAGDFLLDGVLEVATELGREVVWYGEWHGGGGVGVNAGG